MAKNTQVSPVPLNNLLLNEKGAVHNIWAQWFLKLRSVVTNESNQLIEDASRAIELDCKYCALKCNTASTTHTLEVPTLENKWLIIEMTERTNPFNAQLALTNCVGGTAATTATFDAVGETLVLVSKSNKWLVMKEFGVTLS